MVQSSAFKSQDVSLHYTLFFYSHVTSMIGITDVLCLTTRPPDPESGRNMIMGGCGDISYLFNECLHNFVSPLLDANV